MFAHNGAKSSFGRSALQRGKKMIDEDTKPQAEPLASDSEASEEGSLNDMLQELRILLQGAQVLTAFLIVLPFNQGFAIFMISRNGFIPQPFSALFPAWYFLVLRRRIIAWHVP
jgi:hypothetical protein